MTTSQDSEAEKNSSEAEGVEDDAQKVEQESESDEGSEESSDTKKTLQDSLSKGDPEEQRQKSYQGVVESLTTRFATGQISLDDIPGDKTREDVEKRYAQLYGKKEEKDERVSEVFDYVQQQKQKEDSEEAKKLLAAFESGFEDGLPEEAEKEAAKFIQSELKSGKDKKEAAKLAIGHLVSLGYTPDAKAAAKKAAQNAGGRFFGGSEPAPVKKSFVPENPEQKSFAESLKNHGVDPAKIEV